MSLVLDRDMKQSLNSPRMILKAMTGQVRSFAISGFEIPVRAIFAPDTNQDALQALLSPPD